MTSLSPLAQALVDSLNNGEPTGGFEYEFVEGVHEEFKCVICLDVMRDPYQLVECGHLCCRSCLGQLFRTHGVKLFCPIDRTAISMNAMFPDNNIKRKIQNLKIFCEKKDAGCTWEGELSRHQTHGSGCLYVDVLCANEGCSETLKRFEMENHKGHCNWRMAQCPNCSTTMRFFELQGHEEECPAFERICSRGCGCLVRRDFEFAHVEKFCTETFIECPWQYLGCSYRCRRKEIENHLKETDHNQYVHSEIKRLRESVLEMKDKLNGIAPGAPVQRSVEASKNPLYFTWHLTPISEIIQDHEWLSPPFATGSHGYVFSLALLKRQYDTIISIRLVPGLFDQFLPWPLKQNFSIILLDQRSHDDPKHIKKVVDFSDFETDRQIPQCYQRPNANEMAPLFPLMSITNDTLESEQYSANGGVFLVVKIQPYNFEEHLRL